MKTRKRRREIKGTGKRRRRRVDEREERDGKGIEEEVKREVREGRRRREGTWLPGTSSEADERHKM